MHTHTHTKSFLHRKDRNSQSGLSGGGGIFLSILRHNLKKHRTTLLGTPEFVHPLECVCSCVRVRVCLCLDTCLEIFIGNGKENGRGMPFCCVIVFASLSPVMVPGGRSHASAYVCTARTSRKGLLLFLVTPEIHHKKGFRRFDILKGSERKEGRGEGKLRRYFIAR